MKRKPYVELPIDVLMSSCFEIWVVGPLDGLAAAQAPRARTCQM